MLYETTIGEVAERDRLEVEHRKWERENYVHRDVYFRVFEKMVASEETNKALRDQIADLRHSRSRFALWLFVAVVVIGYMAFGVEVN